MAIATGSRAGPEDPPCRIRKKQAPAFPRMGSADADSRVNSYS